MEIVPNTYYENLKRYWRRRRYQKLNDEKNKKKKKLKVLRLGSVRETNRGQVLRIRIIPKLKLGIISLIKYLAKFHDAYVDTMIRLSGNAGNSRNYGLFGSKSILKSRQITMSCGGEEVDGRLVFEIYKRMMSTREVASF
ncbi:Transcriptional repressor NrdR like [Quillaja saponaria]|uniref:Transcriptional repressor NrdR like n=1 Tax=Quillaja saponaria TaxID=32244 RepID=A0AAD7P5U5_QUISA|nr:Transcriptional repressor NrdR like [Quillaja saponaria]